MLGLASCHWLQSNQSAAARATEAAAEAAKEVDELSGLWTSAAQKSCIATCHAPLTLCDPSSFRQGVPLHCSCCLSGNFI